MTAGGVAGEGGQTTVELALALPLVALSALLVVQIGLVVRDDVLVQHAAREGARTAVVSRETGAAARAVMGAGPLRPEQLQTTVSRPAGRRDSIEVRVRYRSVTDVPLVGMLLPDVELTGVAVMVDERGSARLDSGE